jgi:phosphate transport system substrate-binding protein
MKVTKKLQTHSNQKEKLIMKKLLAIITVLAVLMTGALVFTACNGDETPGPGSNPTQSPTNNNPTEPTGNPPQTPPPGNDDFDFSEEILAITRETGSGTRDAFVYRVNIRDGDGNDIIDTGIQVSAGTSDVLTAVEASDYAIGYVSSGSVSPAVRALTVDGVAPTADNIRNGSYEIQRPFMIMNNKEMNESAEDFWSFIISKEGQEFVESRGLVSDIANPEPFVTNGASGTIDVGGSTSVEDLMNRLVAEYKKAGGNVTVNVHAQGSSAGVNGATDGTYAIGMASRAITAEEAEKLDVATLALDGVAVIVNSANPTTNITVEELKEIYLKDLTRWDEVTR